MGQLSLFNTQQAPRWSVSELTRYLRDLIESDYNLQDVWVSGEISNLAQPRSGHMYFTIKDARSTLRCVMWKSQAARVRFLPKNGDAVEVHGKVSVYDAGGQYQLYADALRPAGEGALYQEFLRLKAKLEAEGLFDEERKQPIPHWPARIAIVTSPTGAALQDMLNTLRRRYPLAEVILAPTAVQGAEAPAGIVAALLGLNQAVQPDLILVARGGGSIEDLWAFNDEYVVRAISGSQAPVISGIGHETDYTLSDFAADLRAPTPTAAAELATPDQVELRQGLKELSEILERSLLGQLESLRWQLIHVYTQFKRYAPEQRIYNDRQRLDELAWRSRQALAHRLSLERLRLDGAAQQLGALNPLAVLGRGFALVSRHDGSLVRSSTQVQPGERIQVRVSDGTFNAAVENSQLAHIDEEEEENS